MDRPSELARSLGAIKLIRDLDISEIDKDTEYSIVGLFVTVHS